MAQPKCWTEMWEGAPLKGRVPTWLEHCQARARVEAATGLCGPGSDSASCALGFQNKCT